MQKSRIEAGEDPAGVGLEDLLACRVGEVGGVEVVGEVPHHPGEVRARGRPQPRDTGLGDLRRHAAPGADRAAAGG